MSKSGMMCDFCWMNVVKYVVDEVVIEAVVEGSLNLNDEGRHCEDDLVNEHVKVGV